MKPMYKKFHTLIYSIVWAIIIAVPVIAYIIWGPLDFVTTPIIIAVAVLAIILFISILLVNYKGIDVYNHSVDDDNIIIHRGVLFKETVIIPIRRIQHVKFEQNIIYIKCKMAKIRIINGGGIENVKYVDENVAKELCDQLTSRLNRYIENDEI